MSTEDKSWFERNMGLVILLGYLATVIIGGIFIYNANLKSTEALTLAKNQRSYEISKDSANKIQDAKRDAKYDGKFRLQDSLNMHQDSFNKHQVSVNLQQSRQIRYVRKLSESILNNPYFQQVNANIPPPFVAREFVIDSAMNKPAVIRFGVYNASKTTVNVKKISTFLWNQEKYIVIKTTPVNGQGLEPTSGYSKLSMELPDRYDSKLNSSVVLLIQVFYEDNTMKGLQLHRIFLRFDKYNPIEAVQVDGNTQEAMLNYIKKFKKQTKKDFLDFSFDGSRSN